MATRHDLYIKFGPKAHEAFSILLLREINLLRSWTADFQTEVAAATSLADLKSRVAALPTLNNRTTQQLIDALDTDLSGVADYTWMGTP